ncbi:hypothetical protein EAG_16426 [Camponotus floridanus]|uniref:Uncharacterized protein n=1 Tax=Camponotus floridanus TaxID=104421 RepID=E2ASQ1_CAMFO|nr:hypothetical protein EAG_16426 [Camponotus floridanus]
MALFFGDKADLMHKNAFTYAKFFKCHSMKWSRLHMSVNLSNGQSTTLNTIVKRQKQNVENNDQYFDGSISQYPKNTKRRNGMSSSNSYTPVYANREDIRYLHVSNEPDTMGLKMRQDGGALRRTKGWRENGWDGETSLSYDRAISKNC